MSAIKIQDPEEFRKELKNEIKKTSDKLIEIFLGIYLLFGFFISFYYDTWLIGFTVGPACIIFYFITKTAFYRRKRSPLCRQCNSSCVYGAIHLSNAWFI